MSIPENLLYTKDHEWLLVEDNIATIGISDYAQGQLGDIVLVELPAENDELTSGETLGNIDSVKASEELFSPVSGKVTEVNESAMDDPIAVNNAPYTEGWLIKVELNDKKELEDFMKSADYISYLEELDG